MVLLIILAACGGGLQPGEVSPGRWTNFDGSNDERQIAGKPVMIQTWEQWTKSPWYRPNDDPIMPKYVAIAQDGAGCLIDGVRWAALHEGMRISCRWIPARAR